MKTPGGGYVDAAPVTARLLELRAIGASLPSLMCACDLSKRGLLLILQGKRRWVQKATAERVMRLSRVKLLDKQLIDAKPTHRLVARLRKRGLTIRRIERETGFRYVEPDRKRVSVRVARAVHETAAFYLDDGRDKARVALSPEAVAHAIEGKPLTAWADEATQRAVYRALDGKPVLTTTAARIAETFGVDQEAMYA